MESTYKACIQNILGVLSRHNLYMYSCIATLSIHVHLSHVKTFLTRLTHEVLHILDINILCQSTMKMLRTLPLSQNCSSTHGQCILHIMGYYNYILLLFYLHLFTYRIPTIGLLNYCYILHILLSCYVSVYYSHTHLLENIGWLEGDYYICVFIL